MCVVRRSAIKLPLLRNPDLSTLNAFLLLDKPIGMSSNAALQQVRWQFGKLKPKAGHTGTLDPLATGMLPICLGEATKFAGYLLSSHKQYRTRISFGVATASGDRDGDVIATAALPDLSETKIREVLTAFSGEIEQTPPIYSALKQDGIPHYKLARAGEVVTPKVRRVRIDRIELCGFGADFVDLDIECGTGTYIRSLGRDIALALGSVGHLSQLHRGWVAPFAERPMASAQEIVDWVASAEPTWPEWLVHIDDALVGLELLRLDSNATLALKRGQVASLPQSAAGEYRLRDENDVFFGVGTVDIGGVLRAKRLLATA